MFEQIKLYKYVFLFLIYAVFICSCNEIPKYKYKENTIKILSLNPKTGKLNYMGDPLENSIKLAENEINKQGGLLGKELEIIYADTHSDKDAALKETKVYFEVNKKEIFGIAGAFDSEVSKKILTDFALKNNIVMVSPASSSPEFSTFLDSGGNFFRTVPSAHFQAKAMAIKASKNGYKKGSIIFIDDQYGIRLASTLKSNFIKRDGSIINYVEYSKSNFHNEITDSVKQACQNSPDFLAVMSYGEDGKLILNNWAKAYSHIPLLLSDSLMSDDFISSLDQATKSALSKAVVNGTYPGNDNTNESYKIFRENFCTSCAIYCSCPVNNPDCDKTINGEIQAFVPNAYDAIYLIALAIQKAGYIDKDSKKVIDKDKITGFSTYDSTMLEVTNENSDDDVLIRPGEWDKAMDAISLGKSLNYEGAGSPKLEFEESTGDPIFGLYLIWTIENGKIKLVNNEGKYESIQVPDLQG